MRVLIIGCGYVGLPLGTELARQGHEVYGMRRTNGADGEMAAAGIKPFRADITKMADLASLPGPFDWVVNLVSSSRGGLEEYQQVYLQGARNLIEALKASPPSKYLYTSSTSVYGQADGAQVKETSPTEPGSETSRVLVETENVLLHAWRTHKFPAVILRVAGIYGPGRGHLFHQFLKYQVKIVGKGDRHINMIHLDDLVGVIIAALQDAHPGEIYNAVDDEPVTHLHFFRWLAETLGRPMPPIVPELGSNPERKRGITNKKVSNRKLKMELGYQFKHPTFRQGYTAEIIRMEQAGELELKPDVRGEERVNPPL